MPVTECPTRARIQRPNRASYTSNLNSRLGPAEDAMRSSPGGSGFTFRDAARRAKKDKATDASSSFVTGMGLRAFGPSGVVIVLNFAIFLRRGEEYVRARGRLHSY